MRILLLSDIHSNLEALEACLEEAPEYDRVFNLGDVVGYGANPNEVTERARALGEVFVRGNHDKACSGIMSLEGFNPVAAQAVMWTRERLTPQNFEFLRGLPQGPVAPLENLQCVHGSPRDEDEYVLMRREAYWIDDHTESEGSVAPAYASSKGKAHCSLPLSPARKYLINPGSIGQPRDGDPRA